MSVDSRYIRIATKFWQDEKARRLSDDAKLLYLYVLTSPHSNMAGYYVLPKPYVVYDLQWLPERLDKAFNELLRMGIIKYCEQNDVVFIPNFFKYNPIQNRNQAVGVARRVSELPANTLQKDFLAAVKRFAQPFLELFAERLTEWFGNTETETETETDTETEDKYICASKAAREHLAGQDSDENVEADKVTVQPDEQTTNGRAACQDPGGSVEAEMVTATPGEQQVKTPLENEGAGEKLNKPRPPFTSKKQEQLFDEFWAQYPKKRSKGQAERAWVKIKPDEQLFKAILDGLERAKTSVEWQKDGGQYIPYPSTWLNAKGWEDECDIAVTKPRRNDLDEFF